MKKIKPGMTNIGGNFHFFGELKGQGIKFKYLDKNDLVINKNLAGYEFSKYSSRSRYCHFPRGLGENL